MTESAPQPQSNEAGVRLGTDPRTFTLTHVGEWNEAGSWWAELTDDDTCVGVGDSPTEAVEALFAEYQSLNRIIGRSS